MADTVTTKTLDQLFSSMPTGSLERAIANNLRGINHRQIPGNLPSNRDMPGYTFFVRPQLNMQADNIRNVRKLSMLLNNVPTSMQRYIRCVLDPRLMNGVAYASHAIPPIDCPIFDNLQAFIPVLTNNMTSISGWPSISVPTFSSKPGLFNESFTMVDGRVVNNETYDLNANFRNTRGDPVLLMFYTWAMYMSFVFEGKLVPYLDFITENELDYNTRIYRIVTDYRRQTITKIAATNVAIPTGVPVGDAFDIPGDKPYSEANTDISMRFKCTGVDYFDDVLAYEFNKTVAIFNPSMSDKNRPNSMIAIDPKLINSFNFKGYPYINAKTAELEWYTSLSAFNTTATSVLEAIPETNSEDYTGD